MNADPDSPYLQIHEAAKGNQFIDRQMLTRLKLLEQIELDAAKLSAQLKPNEAIMYDRPLHSVPGLVAQVRIQPLQDVQSRLSVSPQRSEPIAA